MSSTARIRITAASFHHFRLLPVNLSHLISVFLVIMSYSYTIRQIPSFVNIYSEKNELPFVGRAAIILYQKRNRFFHKCIWHYG